MTDQQNFNKPSQGQADWDADLNANFTIAERGQHVKATAGEAINTGDALWVNSGNFAFKFDPNSETIYPHLLAYKSVASGEEDTFLHMGQVRSLAVWSECVPGEPVFVSPATPGALVGSYSAASRPVGFGLFEDGVRFNPFQNLPEQLTRSNSVACVTGSDHLFSVDIGKRGVVRQLKVIGDSADLVTVKLHSNSSRVASVRLYETKSGGVTTVGSFIDQALFPYANTDPSTLSGLIYATLHIESDAAVGSDTLTLWLDVERTK